MARNPELEAILPARYDLEACEPGQKAECRASLLARKPRLFRPRVG